MKPTFIYAVDLDKITKEQFDHCMEQDFVIEGALMPDAHAGYVAPIGSVLRTKGFIVPSWVGFDIGCGMTAARISGDFVEKIKKNQDKIFEAVKNKIPMGKGATNRKEDITPESQNAFAELVSKFQKGPHDKNVLQFLNAKAITHLGSLGDGNHFVEIGHENNEAWIIVHSGSRGVGFKVAERYMKKSAGKIKHFEQTFPLDVSSKLGAEYLNVLDFGLEFALLNRLEMIRKTVLALEEVLSEKVPYEIWVNKNHNHAIPDGDTFIHRKGATPANLGEKGVIPANMRDGCFLVEGLGNKDFIFSSSHGAGRKMSRTGAKDDISMEQFKESMKGIKGTVTQGTLDEAPMAYKDIFEVMKAQEDSVKALKQILPLINWKGERGGRKTN